ncbi:MAG: hypothetical protein IJ371_01300 [Clostridia bacterium]|nr:hypothetical protein [Clostridia bacterium]
MAKTYAYISRDLLRGIDVDGLKRLIKREGDVANKRIRTLKKTGLLKYNHYYNNNAKIYLADDKIGNGTKSGLFSLGTKNKTKEQLLEQYFQIRKFLSRSTTVTATRKRITKLSEVYDTSEDIIKMVDRLNMSGLISSGTIGSPEIAIINEMENNYDLTVNEVEEDLKNLMQEHNGNVKRVFEEWTDYGEKLSDV